MPGLEIETIEGFPLRAGTVLKIRTREGIVGWGEGASIGPQEIARLRQVLTGRPATAYEALRSEAPQAAVNIALLDIAGKFVKAPVYEVLAGPTRHKVRAMTAITGESDLARARAAGFRAFMVRPAGGILQVVSQLEALRAAGAEEIVLDGGGALAPSEAASICAALERFHLLWFDESAPPLSLAALRKLAAERVTPIGIGRSIQRASDFQDLLREDAIDVLRPSLGLHGISGIRKMAALAETYYVAVAPYHDGGPIATAAALHLAASLPNFFIQQIPPPDRSRAEIVREPVEAVKDGFAALPSGPGLGITVNEDALRRYAV